MQKMFIKLNKSILLLSVLVLVSCSKTNLKGMDYQSIDLNYRFSIVFKDRERVKKFKWKLKLPIDNKGNYIIPRTCDEFKNYIPKIYPSDLVELLLKAKNDYLSLPVLNIDELNSFDEELEDFFELETGDFLDGYFLRASFDKIIIKWGLVNNNSKILCSSNYPDLENKLNAIGFTVINKLLDK